VSAVELKYAGKAIDLAVGKVRDKAARALYSACIRGISVIQGEIIPSRHPQPVDRGTYRAGWRAKPLKGEGGKLVGGELYNAEASAALIELGVRADNVKIGRAMIQALVGWARRHGMGRRFVHTSSRVRFDKATGKFAEVAAKGRVEDSEKQLLAVAWAIAKKMKKRGIFGPQGLRILEELMVRRMPGIVSAELEREFGSE
jgi:hypothetical protein